MYDQLTLYKNAKTIHLRKVNFSVHVAGEKDIPGGGGGMSLKQNLRLYTKIN